MGGVELPSIRASLSSWLSISWREKGDKDGYQQASSYIQFLPV